MTRFRHIPFDYAVRNLGRSPVRLAASLVGASLVVLLVLAAGGFMQGMQRTLAADDGLHDNVMLLGAGSEESLERSQIDASVASIVAASVPGLLTRAGVTFVSPEIHIALPLREDAQSTTDLPAVLRGVRDAAFLVHPEVEIIDGRLPRSGHDEIIVGRLAATRLGVPAERLDVGRTLYLDRRDWTIVGRFQAPGTVMDAEIWMPLSDLQIASKREQSLSCVIMSLDRATFADVDMFAKSRLDLELTAMSERAYYRSIAAFYGPIRAMVLVTAVLIALGGVLGGLNTMYAAFAARVREIGVLQCLGFGRPAIVVSLLEESLIMAAAGSVIGGVAGLVLLDGLAVRISMGAFVLTVDGPVVLAGLAAGLIVGVVGAVPPAIRCLRLPLTEALRAP
ncbi:MAG: FtsX-like permease family protein [Phycisphaerales bacterium]|nr:FtsX-like permease family protein [Phycisphaerales bacterium]